jgi:hypothetical protein
MGRERERERERDGVAAAAAVTGDGSCRVSNDPDHHRPHLKKATLTTLIHTYIRRDVHLIRMCRCLQERAKSSPARR